MVERQRDWPVAMTTRTTHDTKRGEDVRARITALAEVPDAGSAHSTRCWRGILCPTPAFGNLLWQAVVGAWPAASAAGTCARACTTTPRRRCARPATAPRGPQPDDDYERAVHAAVDACFDDPETRRLLDDLARARWRTPAGSTGSRPRCSR